MTRSTAPAPAMRHGRGAVLLVAALAIDAATAPRARPGSVARRRPVRPGPGAPVRLALRRGAAGRDPDRDPRGRRRRHRDPGLEGGHVRLRRGRPEPDRLRPRRDCGVNGLACFTRSAPNGFTMWFREQGHVYDWGTLRWCQSYTTAPNGCYDAETIALDEFGHVEGLDHHVNYADDHDYEDAVVQTFSRTKPAAGWNTHAFGPCDIDDAPAAVRPRRRWSDQGLDLPGPHDDADADRLAGLGRLRRERRPSPPSLQDRGAATRTAGSPQPARRPDRQPPAPRHRDDGLGRRRDHVGRPELGHLRRRGPPRDRLRVPRGLRRPGHEGLKGATSATFRVVVAGCAGSTCPLAPPAAAAPAGRPEARRDRSTRRRAVARRLALASPSSCRSRRARARWPAEPVPERSPARHDRAADAAAAATPAPRDPTAEPDARRSARRTPPAALAGRRGRRPGRRAARLVHLGRRRVGQPVAAGRAGRRRRGRAVDRRPSPAARRFAAGRPAAHRAGATSPVGAIPVGSGAGPDRLRRPGVRVVDARGLGHFADGLGSAT